MKHSTTFQEVLVSNVANHYRVTQSSLDGDFTTNYHTGGDSIWYDINFIQFSDSWFYFLIRAFSYLLQDGCTSCFID